MLIERNSLKERDLWMTTPMKDPMWKGKSPMEIIINAKKNTDQAKIRRLVF